MRKSLLGGTAAIALLGALPLHAGGIEPVTDPEVIAADTSSSSGGIIVPLLLLVLIAAALSGGGGGGETVVESDRRIKTDVQWVGLTADSLPVYRYRYKGTDPVFEGVMAQDVALRRPDALVRRSNGLLAVDYGRLGVPMRQVA